MIVALVVMLAFLSCGHGQLLKVISTEVQFMGNAPSGNLMLQGTLTTPEGITGIIPGIVLVAGSGPGQRNESVDYGMYNFQLSPPKAPSCGASSVSVSVFVDIAEYFSARGYAVLRYDKRSWW